MKLLRLLYLLLVCACFTTTSSSQETGSYSRSNTFEVFASGSNTSSHILMGYSRNRQLGGFGVGYARRVLHTSAIDVSYLVEVRPVLFESDPVVHTVGEYHYALQGTSPPYRFEDQSTIVLKCTPSSGQITYNAQEYILYATACGRQRTFAQAFAPLGFKIAGRNHHPLQPTLAGTLGYLYSNRPIPVADAGNFNFAFDIGPGLEYYRDNHRSLAIEYRYHHFSNHETARENPGTDNMMLKVSYNFGH